jgi:hypothetical protein
VVGNFTNGGGQVFYIIIITLLPFSRSLCVFTLYKVLNNVGTWDLKRGKWQNLANGTNGPVYAVAAGENVTCIDF